MKSRYHIRSVSLPSKSNPIISRIGEELNKLKVWEDVVDDQSSSASTLETIFLRLSGLVEIYKCIDDALNLNFTSSINTKTISTSTSTNLEVVEKKKNSNSKKKQQVDDIEKLLESSLRFIDLSSSTKDMDVQLKESIRELQSSLRRIIKQNDVENIIMGSSYLSLRKEIVKVAKRGIKRMDIMNFVDYVDQGRRSSTRSSVINALRFVSMVNVSVYRSLLSLLATPVAVRRWSTSSKWFVVSKKYLGTNNEVDEELMIIIKSVEVALISLCSSSSRCSMELEARRERSVGAVQSKLNELEMGLEGIEGGLEGLFRQLIKTRVSLLNIIGSI